MIVFKHSIPSKCYDLNREEGIGIPKKLNEAFFWLRKAAKQGDSFAKDQLKKLGVSGKGVDKD